MYRIYSYFNIAVEKYKKEVIIFASIFFVLLVLANAVIPIAYSVLENRVTDGLVQQQMDINEGSESYEVVRILRNKMANISLIINVINVLIFSVGCIWLDYKIGIYRDTEEMLELYKKDKK